MLPGVVRACMVVDDCAVGSGELFRPPPSQQATLATPRSQAGMPGSILWVLATRHACIALHMMPHGLPVVFLRLQGCQLQLLLSSAIVGWVVDHILLTPGRRVDHTTQPRGLTRHAMSTGWHALRGSRRSCGSTTNLVLCQCTGACTGCGAVERADWTADRRSSPCLHAYTNSANG
jgi:hypothetical protein